MKKNLIALIMSIVMMVGSIGGSSVFAAETTSQEASEITQEEVAEELEEVPEENEDADKGASAEDNAEEKSVQNGEEAPFDVIEPEQSEYERQIASNGEEVEVSMEDMTESITEEFSIQSEEIIETSELEHVEDGREAELDVVANGNVAQAIWTKGNTTLTFYNGSQVSAGDSFKGETVTSVWSGSDVTNTGEKKPVWSTTISNYVTSVVFDISFLDVKPISSYKWFDGCSNLKTIDFQGFNTSNVTNMVLMFNNCSSLTELDVSGFNTSNVTEMRNMFYKCSSLTELDVSNFDTSNVTLMDYMFYKCSSLTELDVSNFDTSNVTLMDEMFYECSSLTELDVSSFDTSNVSSMNHMFYNCSSLTELDVSGFDTSNVCYMHYMFYNCSSLTELDVSGFDTSNVTFMYDMFEDCSSLTKLDVSGFDTSNVEVISWMFSGCSSLTELDVSNFDMSRVVTNRMFSGCSKLRFIFCKDSSTKWTKEGRLMFDGCSSLVGIDGDYLVTYDSEHSSEIMAKSASLGGYFTPKNTAPLIYPLPIEFYPEPGAVNVDHNSKKLFFIDFANKIMPKDGYAYLYKTGNDSTPVDRIHISTSTSEGYLCEKNGLELYFSIDKLQKGSSYYITIDKNALVFVDDNDDPINMEFPGFNKNIWTFTTVDLDYFSFPNPTQFTVPLSLYREFYGCLKSRRLRNNEENGSNGLCFGLDYLIGLNKLNGGIIKYEIAAEKNISDLKINNFSSIKPDNLEFNLLQYLQLAFIYQYYPEMSKQAKDNKNKYDKLYEAIGKIDKEPITIGFRTGENYHAIFPITIIKNTEESCDVLVYDSKSETVTIGDHAGIVTYLNTLKLIKNGDGISGIEYGGSRCNDVTYRGIDLKFDEKIGVPYTTLQENQAYKILMSSERLLQDVRESVPIAATNGDDTASFSGKYLYWLDSSILDLKFDERNTISVTGDYDEIEVTADAGASIRLDFENNAAKIENDEASEKGYTITHTHAEDDDNTTSIVINGETSSTVNTESSDKGIIVNYEDDTHFDAVIGISKNGEEVGSVDVSATTNKVNVTYDDNETLIVWEDIDSDGSYETIIATSVEKTVEDAEITGINNKQYTGSPIEQSLTVTYDGLQLTEGTDYTVGYENNINPGTATITISGIGNYTWTITKTFMILPGKTTRGDMFNLANNVKVTWKEVPGAKYYKVYREGVTDPKESRKDPVIVTERLIGWDQQPGLTNGHAYRYKIVASLSGKGDSSGDSPLSYSKLMYRLKTVVIRSVKNTAPGKVTVKYDKTTSGDSYVLQYCERQDMVGAKTKVVLGANNTSYVIGGLKKGKTYYISIRVRKKVNGIDYYTTFGVPKKVTVTK